MASHSEGVFCRVDCKVCTLLPEEEGEPGHERDVPAVELPDAVLALFTSESAVDGLDSFNGPDDEGRASVKNSEASTLENVISDEQALHLGHPVVVLDCTEPGDPAREQVLVVASDDELAAVGGLLVGEPEGEHVLIEDAELDQVEDGRDARFTQGRVAHPEDAVPRANAESSPIQNQCLAESLVSNLETCKSKGILIHKATCRPVHVLRMESMSSRMVSTRPATIILALSLTIRRIAPDRRDPKVS